MTLHPTDPLTGQGIAAFKMGRHDIARRCFEAALNQDEHNVMAWWWLARVISDPHASHKCMEQCRGAAVLSQENLDIYRALIEEDGAPVLQPYQLEGNSRSVGSNCPIDSVGLSVGDTIILCPNCQMAHHVDCWECNAYHCGAFGCEGSGTVDRQASPQVEAPAAVEALAASLDEEDILEVPRYATREEKEAGFVGKLRARAAATMMENFFRQSMAEEIAHQAREQREARARREAERRAQEWGRKVTGGILAGTVVGIILAIAANPYFHDWLVFLFIVFLGIASLASWASHAYLEQDRFTGGLYWLFPKLIAALILYYAFNQWDKAWLAVLVAAIGGFIVERIFSLQALRERRAFIVYTTLALGGLAGLRYYLLNK